MELYTCMYTKIHGAIIMSEMSKMSHNYFRWSNPTSVVLSN